MGRAIARSATLAAWCAVRWRDSAALAAFLTVAGRCRICSWFFVANESLPGGIKPEATGFGRIGPWVVIFSVTLLAYLPTVNGGLIMDDAEHVTAPELRSIQGLQRIWF